MEGLDIYPMPWIISNIVGILMLWTAYKQPRLARVMFVLFYGWASWFNYTTAHATPEVYLDYASMSVGLYSEFILGWFSHNITLVISVIALGQGVVALGMLLRSFWVKLGCVGAIIFLLSIAPLGVPFSIQFQLQSI